MPGSRRKSSSRPRKAKPNAFLFQPKPATVLARRLSAIFQRNHFLVEKAWPFFGNVRLQIANPFTRGKTHSPLARSQISLGIHYDVTLNGGYLAETVLEPKKTVATGFVTHHGVPELEKMESLNPLPEELRHWVKRSDFPLPLEVLEQNRGKVVSQFYFDRNNRLVAAFHAIELKQPDGSSWLPHVWVDIPNNPLAVQVAQNLVREKERRLFQKPRSRQGQLFKNLRPNPKKKPNTRQEPF